MTFAVTPQIRDTLRREVKAIMRGSHTGHRGLTMPVYLGGDMTKLGKVTQSVEALLNPVDPVTVKSHTDPVTVKSHTSDRDA
jgi:hypothetical protein